MAKHPFAARTCALAAALAIVGGCTQPTGSGWQGDRVPSVSDTNDCRFEARRQAELRYPDPVRRDGTQTVTYENPHRFEAEMTYFNACMRRKGFVRVPP
jgi:hypothetical protein